MGVQGRRPFDPQLIPRWGHLLMRPPALYAHLCTLTTPRTAAEVVHFVYNSPHINRLFAEDYIDYVRMSRFEVDTLSIAFPSPIEAGVQTKLEALYPGRRLFSTHGMMMVLRRRE